MARTLTTQEGKVYESNNFSVSLQVWIKDGTGTFIDLTDLEGVDWVESVEISDDIDQPVMAATIQLIPSAYDLKLSPLVTGSKINNPSGGLEERIAIDREVVILAAVMPLGSEPASTDWRLLFRGDTDQVDSATMRLSCVDLGGRLQRLKLERTGQPPSAPGSGTPVDDGGPYIAAGATTAAETVMQAVLDDWAPSLSITLATPSSPGWSLTEAWKPSDQQNVLDVLRGIAHMIGWEVRYVFDATLTDPFGVTAGAGGVGNFKLAFFEPDRSNTTPLITLGPDEYFSITQLEDVLGSVANRVEVMYRNGPLQTDDIDSVIAEDSASQTAYGVLYMRVPADATTGITAQANAETLADNILSDVADATAAMQAEAAFRYDLELYDLIRFSSNGEIFDSNQDLATAGFRHRFSEGKASTSINLRGTVAGHRGNWWLAATGDFSDLFPDSFPNRQDFQAFGEPVTPTLTNALVLGGFELQVTNPPPDLSHVEWHIDTSNGFTPSSSTLSAISSGTTYVAPNLTQGTTHYAKAIFVSKKGVKSAASTQTSALPGETIAKLEVEEAFFASKAWEDGMPFATTIDRAGTNYCKNPSFETDVTLWEEYSSDASATAPTLSRVTTAGNFVFGAAAMKVANGDSAWTGFIGAAITKASAPVAASGEVWSASAWVKASTAIGVTIQIEFYTAGDVSTGSTGYSLDVSTGWVPISLTSDAAGASTAYAILRIFSYTANTAFDLYIDGVVLEEANTPSEFFDGSLGQGYAWTGTQHLSTSTRTGGLTNHGALAADADSFIVYEDGEVSHGQLTPSVGSAAKVGLPGHALRIAGAGAAFPPTPTDQDLYFRTDRALLYYYDETAGYWLTVQEYCFTFQTYAVLPAAMTTTASVPLSMSLPDLEGGTTLRLEKWTAWTYHTGAPMSANYWTVSLKNSAGTTIGSFATNGDTSATDTEHTNTSVNSVRTRATDKYWYVQCDKTSTPGNLYLYGVTAHCRLIG